jgi:hypothetical protein
VRKLEARIRDLQKALYLQLQESVSERDQCIEEMRADHKAALAAADQQRQEALASAEKHYWESTAFTEERLKYLECQYHVLVTQMAGIILHIVLPLNSSSQ